MKPLRMIKIFSNYFDDIHQERTFFLRQQDGKEMLKLILTLH